MGDGVGALHAEGNALLKAVFQGKMRLTRLLLEGGAYINEGNERGETAIAAACLAGYEDAPQDTRHKMVRYLLERGADPNIPDKSGRTALMHACAGQAGREVVSLLLESGADPSLKDYAGASALVHAINKGDRDTLQILLDTCKAKGKEVIIITTDTSPSGTKKTKQYLNSPPSPGLVVTTTAETGPGADNISNPSPSAAMATATTAACMSPSDVEIRTASSPSVAGEIQDGIFSFALTSSALPLPSSRLLLHPGPGERRGGGPPGPRKLLKRLNSEPWGLVAPSALALGSTPQEKAEEKLLAEDKEEVGEVGEGERERGKGTKEEVVGERERERERGKVTKAMNGLSITGPGGRPLLSRRHSIETHDPGLGLAKLMDRSCSEDWAGLYGASWADKVQQHQMLYRRNTAPESQEAALQPGTALPPPPPPLGVGTAPGPGTAPAPGPGPGPAPPLGAPPMVGLRGGLAHPKLIRMEHYESDTHLCPAESIPGSPDSGRASVAERRKYNASPLSLLVGAGNSSSSSSSSVAVALPASASRESLESIPNSVSPIAVRRRHPGSLLERRGSGTLLLDHISQTRPGFLPPLNLNPHRPIPDIRTSNGKAGNAPSTSPVHSGSGGGSGGSKVLMPVAPPSPSKRCHGDFKVKKKLMRRHSMQTEQMKQLSTFKEILTEKVIEFTGD